MRAATSLDRSVRCAALIAAVFGGVSAASAAATTVKVGQLFTPNYPSCSGGTALQTHVASGNSYRVPKDGVITSWSWHDGANTVPGLQLKVGRQKSGATYKIVGQATAGGQTPNTVHTYHTHIRVHAGDLIGVYENGGSCYSATSSPKDRYAWVQGTDVAAGMKALFAGPLPNGKFPVAVKVRLG